jgi:tetratricopeptide (TPR) repeat protein
MEPGQILDNRLLVLQEMERTEYVPIDKWLAYSGSYSDVQKSGADLYQHYSYWWAFCHFLATSKKYDKKFFGYFKDFYALQGFKTKTGYGGVDTGGIAYEVEPAEYTAKLLERLGVKDIKKLDEEFRAWIKSTEPVGARGYFYVGRDLTQMRKYDDGLKNLDIAISKGYDTAECYAMRARAWEGKSQMEKANADWRKAIEQNPVETSYRQELATNLMFRKDTRAAGLEQLRIAAELDPMDPWIDFRLKEAEKESSGEK